MTEIELIAEESVDIADPMDHEYQEITPALETMLAYEDWLSSEGFVQQCYRIGLLSSTAVLSLEAVGANDNTQAVANDNVKGAVNEKSKSLITRLLDKVKGFYNYLKNKATSFIENTSKRVESAEGIKATAKVFPARVIAAGLGIMGAVAAGIVAVIRVIGGLFSKSVNPEQAVGETASIWSKIKSPFVQFRAKADGKHLVMEAHAVEGGAEKVAARAGGWSLNTLKNLPKTFMNGVTSVSKAVFSVPKALTQGLSTVAKPVTKTGDKAAAGVINKLTKVAASGGIKGFVGSIALFSVVTYLVNSILKAIRWALNSAATLVHNTVDAICGPAQ